MPVTTETDVPPLPKPKKTLELCMFQQVDLPKGISHIKYQLLKIIFDQTRVHQKSDHIKSQTSYNTIKIMKLCNAYL